jgi:calcineurin-like phosphoesterase family protein
MTTWFTSDWHLAHVNILIYCQRPFRDVSHMNEELIARHNAVVQPDDTVIDVGDFSMNEKVVESAIKRLHGRRILVCGNHDRCFRKHKGAARWAKQYLEWGFAEVHQQYELLLEDGQTVRVEHLPYVDDPRHGEKYKELRPIDDGRWLIHGHVHQNWQQKDRMINVGVDVWDYRPVSLDTITERIRRGPKTAS